MSKAPKKITINGHKYKVKFISDLKSEPDENGKMTGYYGFCSHTKRTLSIEKDMCHSVQQITVIHEAMHAIIDMAGHHSIDRDIVETLIQCLGQGVIVMLRDNPKLVEYILPNDKAVADE